MPYLPRRRDAEDEGSQSRDAPALSAGGLDQAENLVYCWRFSQLWEAGYDSSVAEELALSDCDLHEAVDAKRAGCTDAHALAIFL